MTVLELVLKIRPIVAHSRHPLRYVLKRVARALALLVIAARLMVIQKRASHFPMWEMHKGIEEWLEAISKTKGAWGCVEMDVADCFLNTPREEVLRSLTFWADRVRQRSRLQPSFAISKDGKGGDHLGKAAALHYWTLTMQQVVQICQWELKENALFEVLLPTGSTIVLEQVRGLPIGGHLSAAMVELVALQRKFVVEWLPMLQSVTTSRYRDNCFIVIEKEWSEEQVEACAAALTSLLMIP